MLTHKVKLEYTEETEKGSRKGSETNMRKTILLVLDDDTHVELIRSAFLNYKPECEIIHAATIKEALKWLQEVETKQLFAAISDYRLPDGTGLELAGGAKNPEDVGFPVIMLTGHGSEELAVRSFKSGVMDYVVKRAEWAQELPWIVKRAFREWDNIIARKRAEEALEHRIPALTQTAIVLDESRKFLETVIDNIPDTITLKDSEHRFVLVNQAYCNIIGATKDEVIGKTASREKDTEVFQTGAGLDIPERTYMDNKGNRHYVSVKKAPLTDESGNVSHVLTISRDISEFKRAADERERLVKELEAKNAEMERFTYTISHDLKSPLFTIQGFATALRADLERGEREVVETDLKYIEDGAKKMEHLIEDTLQLSRIGRVTNPPEDVQFGEIVKEALEQTAGLIKSSGVEVSVPDGFPTVHVDRVRIAEVLVNLITNSIKFMGEQQHPKIDIGYREDDEETVFFVRDNSVGIEKSQQEKVFDLFYQLDSGSSEGTGAGLAIVKRIVEVHEGRVWIESEPGKGCTVCFTLPGCSQV